MSLIRILPERLANQIAAGEVIERPASIVKELVENSLDAGAASVEIEIHHGGKSFIRVSDDGSGMNREDVALAFQRHATSKISAQEDLERIGTFGFRGEALPSIAAVSRCRLISRAEGEAVGSEIVIEGGAFKGKQDHPCRRGTIVEIRDLFFNTPARRKFLKADSTELGQVQEVVFRMALSVPKTRFVLKSDDKILLDLPPASRLLDRAGVLLGDGIAGELIELDRQKEGIGFRGLIGKPSLTRGNRSQIHLFVNRRWVKSLPLTYALQAGYHGLLMEGRFPVAMLFLDLDLSRVDVNVHPTKQEVRISQEPEIASLLKQAVQELLRSDDLAPRLKMSGGLPAAGPAERAYQIQAESSTRPWGAVFDGPAVSAPAGSIPLAVETPISVKEKLRITRILGQVHRTFLIAETEEGFVVVDQHAAHERVVFEALLKSLQTGESERQMLFLDEVLELHPRQKEIFQSSLPLLGRLGFDLEPFGGNAWIIRAVPAAFGEESPVQLVQAFLDQMEEGKIRTALEDAQEAVAALCACKRQSVKARDPLEARAIRSLLERLAACENPFTCPHGRPVFFTVAAAQLEKQFKRT